MPTTDTSSIEKLLCEYPGIQQAVVIAQGPEDNKKKIAYIVWNSEYVDAEIEKNQVFHAEQIQCWQRAHDNVYQGDVTDVVDYRTHSAGWISSYAGRPIPSAEIVEWVERTVSRILRLKPRNILEIGCGSGMLLFRLAPYVEHYKAVDFSGSALKYVMHHLKLNKIENVSLHQKDAINISDFDSQHSMVVIHSVAQYFSSIDYLLEVLKKSVDLTCEGGYVFIGDVRSLTHEPSFVASVLLKKMPEDTSYWSWKIAVDQKIQSEEELLIDPPFFYNLVNCFKRVTHVEVLLKSGQYNNEMNNFRYDVILHVGHRTIADCENIFEWKDIVTLDALKEMTRHEAKKNLIIKNIPNKRLIGYNHESEMMSQLEAHGKFIPGFKSYIKNLQESAVHPDLFYNIENTTRKRVLATWSCENPHDFFDLIVMDYNSPLVRYGASAMFASEYVNAPVRARWNKILNKKLKDYLSSHIKDSTIPDIFVSMTNLPMNAEGAVDRTKLDCCPEFLLGNQSSSYQAPTTETERVLHDIWCEVLGLTKISIHERYSEIGGTSLLAARLVALVSKRFAVRLSMQDLTVRAPSIVTLSAFIKKHQVQRLAMHTF